jgi:hypothetical protein
MRLAYAAVRLAPFAAVSVALFVACGGSSNTDITDNAGSGSDGGGAGDATSADGNGMVTGSDSGGGNDSGNGTDAGNGVDGSSLSCMAPKSTSCGKSCVDIQTDNANCGGCGIVCNTTCAMGVCPLISPDAGAPPAVGDNACLAVDLLNVYWANGKATPAGTVYKVPINGGTPVLVQGTLDIPHGIASDDVDVFWTSAGSGEIWKASTNGTGTPTAIVNGQKAPTDIVVTATGLVWLNGDGSIFMSDKSGGNVNQVIAPNMNGGTHNGHLRVGGTTVYWTDTNAGGVFSAPVVKNATATPLTGSANARFLDIDLKDIFYSAGAGATSTVDTTPLAGTTATPLLSNQAASQGVALDVLHLYWANGGSGANTGTINRAKKDGTNVVQLATGQNFPGCIALDALSIYWINEGGGTISKTAK